MTDEELEDLRWADAYGALVDQMSLQLNAGQSPTNLLLWIARVCGGGPCPMSVDRDLFEFADRWGLPSVLRALARALDQRGSLAPGTNADHALVQCGRSGPGGEALGHSPEDDPF